MAVIYFPAALLWSLIYGIGGGIVFKLAAVYETWVAINRRQMMVWKKYPCFSYQKYIQAICAYRMRDKPFELAGITQKQIQGEYPYEPFPVLILITNTLLMLVVVPVFIVTGIVQGPAYVFVEALGFWQ